jgi:hypothetical protein
MADWRLAGSLIELRNQVNAAYPHRSQASDGTIGDAAHRSEGSASDHNPWVKDSHGVGVVRAFDITHDPAHGVDTYAMAERFRVARDSRVTYIISNRRITGVEYGWRWATYTGTSDPHTGHVHVSVSTTQSVYDNGRPWSGVTPEIPDVEQTDNVEYWNNVGRPGTKVGWVLGDQENLRDWWTTTLGQPTPVVPAAGSPLDLLVKFLQSATATAAPADAQVNAAVLAALQRDEVLTALSAAIAAHLRTA